MPAKGIRPLSQRPFVQHYVFDHEAPPRWKGPVVRRDPATYQLPSIQLTWRCQGRHCGHWTMPRPSAPHHCNFCGTPRVMPEAPTPDPEYAMTVTNCTATSCAAGFTIAGDAPPIVIANICVVE